MESPVSHSLFSALRANADAPGGITGLRLAEISEITEAGYILRWLSGPVRSLSAPARAASFMAGAERGAYFPFEVEDEVIVGFVDGHLDQPVILGALWSDQDQPPPGADISGTNNTRTIRSREGSELTFDDTVGKTRVVLKSAGGIEILMEDNPPKLTLKLDGSTKIELSAAGVTVAGSKINLN